LRARGTVSVRAPKKFRGDGRATDGRRSLPQELRETAVLEEVSQGAPEARAAAPLLLRAPVCTWAEDMQYKP